MNSHYGGHFDCSPRCGTAPRRAYVLILVLGIATVVSSAGIAFIHANSTAMPEAQNRLYAARALCMAESGVELAKHYLLYPPQTVPLNDYWRGGTHIALDASSDFTNVHVESKMVDQIPRYTISAVGVAMGFDGGVKAKKALSAEVLLPDAHAWNFKQALIVRNSISVPTNVRIEGSVHSNAGITGTGFCNGAVSASLTAIWTGSGPPTSISPGAPAITLPQSAISYYSSYTLRGETYTAYVHNATSMDATEAAAINALDMSATNPGRVIRVRSGNFQLLAGARLNGTLLVSGGRLDIYNGVEITPVEGFPALIATGDIQFGAGSSNARFNGSVICGGTISDNGNDMVRLDVVGTAIISTGLIISQAQARFNFSYSPLRAWLFNLESPPPRQPITVISWVED